MVVKRKNSDRKRPITAVTINPERKEQLREIASRYQGESISSLIDVCMDLAIQDIETYLKMREAMNSELIKNVRASKGEDEAKKMLKAVATSRHNDVREINEVEDSNN